MTMETTIEKPETADETLGGGLLSPPPCSPDPFPKWKWMMDYCKRCGMSPTLGWDQAEKAWQENNEANVKVRDRSGSDTPPQNQTS